jgi:hypothetical protein
MRLLQVVVLGSLLGCGQQRTACAYPDGGGSPACSSSNPCSDGSACVKVPNAMGDEFRCFADGGLCAGLMCDRGGGPQPVQCETATAFSLTP